MQTIGLIAAMPLESAALLRYIKGWKRIALGTYHGYGFQIKDRYCVLITSGMGLSKAADATAALLSVLNPDLLISFGIAGAMKDDLNIGDVVISENNCLLAEGLPGLLHPLAALSKDVWDAVVNNLRPDGIRLVSGTAITTRGSQVVQSEMQGTANPILEMETFGIAQVTSKFNKPLLSIRSISDGPRSPIPFDLKAIMDDNDKIHICRLLILVLRHPHTIFQSWRLMQNARKAANHAANAVLSVLRQPSPLV
jgi:adenosylhomocysteine nucleosidase